MNDFCCLTTRVLNAMKRAGYKTLNDLDGITQKEVARIMDLGSVGLNEVDWVMEVYGFKYKEEQIWKG